MRHSRKLENGQGSSSSIRILAGDVEIFTHIAEAPLKRHPPPLANKWLISHYWLGVKIVVRNRPLIFKLSCGSIPISSFLVSYACIHRDTKMPYIRPPANEYMSIFVTFLHQVASLTPWGVAFNRAKCHQWIYAYFDCSGIGWWAIRRRVQQVPPMVFRSLLAGDFYTATAHSYTSIISPWCLWKLNWHK